MSAQDFAILDDLFRLIIKAFYSDEYWVVAQLLLREHRAISEEEFARRLKLNNKQIRKYLSKLKDDHLVKSKPDKKDPETGEIIEGKKWQQQTFFYIDYKHFVDVVKYRLHIMQQKVKQEVDRGLECQIYFCPRCNRKYTALEANKLLNMVTKSFHCERCKTELREEDQSERVSQTQTRISTMLTQLRPITEQLKKTEGIVIPKYCTLLLFTDLSRILSGLNGGVAAEQIEDGETGQRVAPVPAMFQQEKKIQITFGKDTTITIKPAPVSDHVKVSAFGTPPKKEEQTKITVSTESKPKETPKWLISSAERQEATKTPEIEAAQVSLPEIKTEEPQPEDTYLKSLREQYLQPTAFHPEETTTTEEDFEEATIPETEEELVSVGEDKIPLSRVTQADIERMTTEEYQAYYDKYQKYLAQYAYEEDAEME